MSESLIIGKKPIGTIAYMGGVFALPEQFAWSWGQMIQFNTEYLVAPNEYIHYDRAQVSYHSFARNTLVERMKGDWLLMLDCDHQFDPDIAARLLYTTHKYKIDVLTGIYQYKRPPYSPVLYRWNQKDAKDPGGYEVIGDWDQDVNVFEIGSSGGGCLLVNKKVFTRIKDELKEMPFDIIHPYSEDHSFFKRLTKLNIKAYCNTAIECNHLAIKPISLKDYDKTNLTFSERYEVGGYV